MWAYEYFRSEDPVEAARFVVSDAVQLLWSRLHAEHGFAGFAARAAPQLVRWESAYGWTRFGDGKVSQQETSLATVLARMLPAPDLWVEFADSYLEALDQLGSDGRGGRDREPRAGARNREDRTRHLAEWHLMLLDRLGDYEADDRLDRLTAHHALAGPELTYLRARLAYQRDDIATARDLTLESLQTLPGHRGFREFAGEIGAPLPTRA